MLHSNNIPSLINVDEQSDILSSGSQGGFDQSTDHPPCCFWVVPSPAGRRTPSSAERGADCAAPPPATLADLAAGSARGRWPTAGPGTGTPPARAGRPGTRAARAGPTAERRQAGRESHQKPVL